MNSWYMCLKRKYPVNIRAYSLHPVLRVMANRSDYTRKYKFNLLDLLCTVVDKQNSGSLNTGTKTD